MNEVEISKKFKPLFQLLDNNWHPEIDTVIITGGRYSLKSYTVSIFSLISLVQYSWNVLYTRFTNMSIVDSIKPEVSDKIELLNLGESVIDTQNQIEYKGNRISFKGVKTGSQQQTANLKSLSGFNLFVNDEAEELPDYKTFKKIFYSIRSTEKRNLTILILNPTTKQHWIFQEFLEKKGLQGGENCIVDNVMYIHSSYLDCDLTKMPNNILRDYQRLLIDNPIDYNNIVLGGWIQEPEGLLIPFSKLNWTNKIDIPPENIVMKFAIGDPADTGGDKFSMPFITVAIIDDNFAVYVTDCIHSTMGIEANTERVLDKIENHGTEFVMYESNGVGLAAVLLIAKQLSKHRKLVPFNSLINKEVRIYSHFEFVQKYFIFDKSLYDTNPEYKSFVNDLTSYSKEADNKHKKDAMDVCCSAANVLKIKYAKYLYS